MTTALARGYATAPPTPVTPAAARASRSGIPRSSIDFGYRAGARDDASTRRRSIAAFYGSAPKFSYWNGCSAGGRQAMKEAQRFPEDFDGIIAGAPGLDWTGRAAQAVRVAQALQHKDAASLLPPAKRQCSTSGARRVRRDRRRQGRRDRNPDAAASSIRRSSSARAPTRDCLTTPQVETARLIYSAPTIRRRSVRSRGLAPGSELGWTDLGWTASARPPASISSASSSSRIPTGISRSSTSPPTSSAPKKPTTTRSTRSIRTSSRSSIAAGS